MLQPACGERRLVTQGGGRDAGPARGAAAQQLQLAQQQLLEGQPAAPRARVLGPAGKVHRGDRAGSVGQRLDDARSGCERLDYVPQRVAGALYEREDLGRADSLCGGVVGDRTSGAGRFVGIAAVVGCGGMMRDAEAAAGVCLAVQQQACAGRVALDQPGLVEERRTHGCGRVEHDGLDQRAHAAAAHGPCGDAADLHGDGGLLARLQRGDGARLAAVAGQVLEQVADRVQAEAREDRQPSSWRARAAQRAVASVAASGSGRRSARPGSCCRWTRTPAQRVRDVASGPTVTAGRAYAARSPMSCAAHHDRRGGRKRYKIVGRSRAPAYSAASSHQ